MLVCLSSFSIRKSQNRKSLRNLLVTSFFENISQGYTTNADSTGASCYMRNSQIPKLLKESEDDIPKFKIPIGGSSKPCKSNISKKQNLENGERGSHIKGKKNREN